MNPTFGFSARGRVAATLSALTALGGTAGCTSQTGAVAPSAVAPGATVAPPDPAPPVGEYALTEEISIVIQPAKSAEGAGEPAWTLTMDDHGLHPLVASQVDGWHVPALDMQLAVAVRDGVQGLQVRRYEEAVFVPPRESSAAVASERARPTPLALSDLAPRLMIGLNVPGVGIALIRGGEIMWRGYFGVKRSGTADRIDSLTVFEAASMSKPAYTYPFMKLVEDGTIDLDTPLVQYLGRDYLPGDTLHRTITARMVLSHKSGFPNWRDDEGLAVLFPPGTQIGYSGEGFQYLQTVVEEVTGKPMAEFTRVRLFEPLGLSSASYVWRDAYDTALAVGHTEEGIPQPRRPYTEANAAYTLYITPVGYARILVEIMRADRSAPHSLSEATRAIMLEPQHMAPDRDPVRRGGQADGEVHYALGWRLDRTPAGDRYWHSGSNSTGFQCYAEFDPETGNGIVVMTNGSSGSPLWRALMNATGQP